jgi:hypothetical protein
LPAELGFELQRIGESGYDSVVVRLLGSDVGATQVFYLQPQHQAGLWAFAAIERSCAATELMDAPSLAVGGFAGLKAVGG